MPEPLAMSASLRRKFRNARQEIPHVVQRQHALDAARNLLRAPVFMRTRKIAFYMASRGEMDPAPIMAAALQFNKQCYLPVMPAGLLPATAIKGLVFQRYEPGRDQLVRNRFGILEPAFNPRRLLAPRMLDLALVPLVAFDENGNRMGMGQGFYDRTFAGIHEQWRRPLLLGMAHEMQRTDGLAGRHWDVPLDGVVTEERIIWTKNPGFAPSR